MIVDSHCHAWHAWPYQPPVPDPSSRGVVEQLLWEMDEHGVDKAVEVCARIDHNPDNNDYVADAARRFPSRLVPFADVDCRWSATYHQPWAARRLQAAVRQYNLRGFTHYFDPADDGSWYLSNEGSKFFETAAELKQIASFAMPPRLQPVLRHLAERFPSVHFLCHHMAGARVSEGSDSPHLREILASASWQNIHSSSPASTMSGQLPGNIRTPSTGRSSRRFTSTTDRTGSTGAPTFLSSARP
jgi:predicted TIM-barrel fold metal-dependent hydrolase